MKELEPPTSTGRFRLSEIREMAEAAAARKSEGVNSGRESEGSKWPRRW